MLCRVVAEWRIETNSHTAHQQWIACVVKISRLWKAIVNKQEGKRPSLSLVPSIFFLNSWNAAPYGLGKEWISSLAPLCSSSKGITVLYMDNVTYSVTHFARIFEAFRITGANRLSVNLLINRLVDLLAFRVVNDGHADVLQPCRNRTLWKFISPKFDCYSFCPFDGNVLKKIKNYFRQVFPIRRRKTGPHRIPCPCPASRWATCSIGMQRAAWVASVRQYRSAAFEYWIADEWRAAHDSPSICLRRWRNRCRPIGPAGFLAGR